MRTVLAIMLFLLLSPGSAAAESDKPLRVIQSHETRVGERLFIKLPGNPKIGYKWKLNRELSTGLDLVSVDQIGWLIGRESKSMFFRPSNVLNVTIVAKSPGKAELAFDYYRNVGGRSLSSTSVVRLNVKP